MLQRCRRGKEIKKNTLLYIVNLAQHQMHALTPSYHFYPKQAMETK